MHLRVLALGNQNVTRRISNSLSGTKIDLVGLSAVSEAITLLKQEKFDLALVDSYLQDIEATCYHITWLCRTPVALVTKGSQVDWSRLRDLEVDGFIPEECPPGELVAQLQAITRRHNRQFSRVKIS